MEVEVLRPPDTQEEAAATGAQAVVQQRRMDTACIGDCLNRLDNVDPTQHPPQS